MGNAGRNGGEYYTPRPLIRAMIQVVKPKISKKSWLVDIADIDRVTFDLSVKNPNKAEESALREPQEILDEIAALDAESAEILAGIGGML
jgi:type I restriction-modification system DNA methylase subunit